MAENLIVNPGQCSEAGVKPVNEDSCGYVIPQDNLINTKGVTVVIADGVSGSDAGKEASDACIKGFLSDYYSTPESWTVKTSGRKVLTALNRWLHGQGHRLYGSARGMATTLSILIVKSTTGYIFHVGDTRIYRLRNRELECLTRDHRLKVSNDKEYLGRAFGIDVNIDIDYRSFAVEKGDHFLLTTDGVHDFVSDRVLAKTLSLLDTEQPEDVCRKIVKLALNNHSNDNVTCQVLHVNELPSQQKQSVYQKLTELPFPPPLEVGMKLDGYRIVRELHASKRTELYLAVDEATEKKVVLKAPSVNFEDDPAFIEQFLHEEWISRRINNPHVVSAHESARHRQCLYNVTEFIDGQTLRQWMHDHPQPTLAETRSIIAQVTKGLRAFHRLEMIHQDLKPENIMIDNHGTIKIIDFGSTKIAGIEEIASPIEGNPLLGTENYTAPEYLQGYAGSNRSDIFSLGVITYEILTGKLPYGQMFSKYGYQKLHYRSASGQNPTIPAWIDGAIKKAVHPDPNFRYESLSEFIGDLSRPNPAFSNAQFTPLIERNPLVFWRTSAMVLALGNLVVLYLLLK